MDVAGVVAKAEPTIVTIHGQVGQGIFTGTAAGSGIVISSNGEVLTNAHVVQGALARTSRFCRSVVSAG